MGKNSSPWTKFDPLTTNIFRIYNFITLEIIKFVALHKSQHQFYVSQIQKQKNSLDFLNNFKFTKKIREFLQNTISLPPKYTFVKFMINLLAVVIFVLGDSFNRFNSLS